MRPFARIWLCAYLLGWVPLNYAAEVSRTLPSIGFRGAPAAIELATHGLIAATSAAAGWMLWIGTAAGSALAATAVLAAAAGSVQSLYWSALPHNLPPGTKLPLALVAMSHGAGWFLYLRRRGDDG